MNVLMIGPRGCGKTSVGRLLAETLSMRFVDLDDQVLGRFEESTVTDVWSVHGEPAWRKAEVIELDGVLTLDRQVVALGGGTPVITAARRMIEQAHRERRAWVVYLACSVEMLQGRLAAEGAGDRPSLTGVDPVAEIASVLGERAPVYEALADVIHAPGTESAAETAGAIATRLDAMKKG